MIEQPLVLTQSALRDFAECPRRFQLRYLQQLPWPQAPVYGDTAVATTRGREFHRLLERHFLGIPTDEDVLSDPVLRGWWTSICAERPGVPRRSALAGARADHPRRRSFPQWPFRPTDCLGNRRQGDGTPLRLENQPPAARKSCSHDWQTRLYLGMLAQSGSALTEGERPLTADTWP